MNPPRPTVRIVYLDDDPDQQIKISDGDDALGGTDSFAIDMLNNGDVYIDRAGWEKIKRAVDDYFAEMQQDE